MGEIFIFSQDFRILKLSRGKAEVPFTMFYICFLYTHTHILLLMEIQKEKRMNGVKEIGKNEGKWTHVLRFSPTQSSSWHNRPYPQGSERSRWGPYFLMKLGQTYWGDSIPTGGSSCRFLDLVMSSIRASMISVPPHSTSTGEGGVTVLISDARGPQGTCVAGADRKSVV